MITVTVRVGKEDTGTTEAISAPSIREAVAIAQARYPGEEIRVAYPIDGEAFFLRPQPREAAGHL
jgi:hypothetical protein